MTNNLINTESVAIFNRNQDHMTLQTQKTLNKSCAISIRSFVSIFHNVVEDLIKSYQMATIADLAANQCDI